MTRIRKRRKAYFGEYGDLAGTKWHCIRSEVRSTRKDGMPYKRGPRLVCTEWAAGPGEPSGHERPPKKKIYVPKTIEEIRARASADPGYAKKLATLARNLPKTLEKLRQAGF